MHEYGKYYIYCLFKVSDFEREKNMLPCTDVGGSEMYANLPRLPGTTTGNSRLPPAEW